MVIRIPSYTHKQNVSILDKRTKTAIVYLVKNYEIPFFHIDPFKDFYPIKFLITIHPKKKKTKYFFLKKGVFLPFGPKFWMKFLGSH